MGDVTAARLIHVTRGVYRTRDGYRVTRHGSGWCVQRRDEHFHAPTLQAVRTEIAQRRVGGDLAGWRRAKARDRVA